MHFTLMKCLISLTLLLEISLQVSNLSKLSLTSNAEKLSRILSATTVSVHRTMLRGDCVCYPGLSLDKRSESFLNLLNHNAAITGGKHCLWIQLNVSKPKIRHTSDLSHFCFLGVCISFWPSDDYAGWFCHFHARVLKHVKVFYWFSVNYRFCVMDFGNT